MTNDAQPTTPARPLWGIVGLVAVVLGAGLMTLGFLAGLDAAFRQLSELAAFYTVLFFLGAALVLAGLVIGVMGLVKGRNRILSVITILIGLLPAAGVVLLRLSVSGAFA